MAGNISQLMAHRHSDRIKTLTLVCTTPTDARLRGLTADLKEYSDSPLAAYELEFQNIFQNSSYKEARASFYQEIVNKNYCQVDPESVIHYIDNLFKSNSTDYLNEIKAHTRIMAGKWDIAFPLDQVRLLHEGMANSRFHEFAASGHMPFLTQHDRFNLLLDEFISTSG